MNVVTINVKVVPGARKDEVAGRYGDGIKVRVSAPPDGGRANEAVIHVIAEALGLKPSQVQIVRGHTQPRKVVGLGNAEQSTVDAWLAGL